MPTKILLKYSSYFYFSNYSHIILAKHEKGDIMMNNFNRNGNMNGRNMPQSRYGNMQKNQQTNRQQQSSANNQSQSKPNQTQGNEQLDNLVNKASKHLNTTPDELKNAAQSGNIKNLLAQMPPSQAAQLERILSDENAAKKLLSTPQAQALLRGLQKNE